MKKLTRKQYIEIEDLLEEAEGRLRFTCLDDEALLINQLRSYLRMKANKKSLKRDALDMEGEK